MSLVTNNPSHFPSSPVKFPKCESVMAPSLLALQEPIHHWQKNADGNGDAVKRSAPGVNTRKLVPVTATTAFGDTATLGVAVLTIGWVACVQGTGKRGEEVG